MLLKTKKLPLFLSAALVLVIAFAIIAVACGSGAEGSHEDDDDDIIRNYVSGPDALSWGVSTEAKVLTLGLTPGNDTTEVNLNWYSTGLVDGRTAKVRFIRGTLTEGRQLIEETGAVSEATASNFAHKVTVKGLRPGWGYQYAVSTDGVNWTDAYNFAVPAATGNWKFAVIADPQLTDVTTGSQGKVDENSRYPATTVLTAAGWAETMGIIMTKGVSFIAGCGDQVDVTTNGNEAEYTNFFAPAGLRNLPFSPVAGNHDRHLPYNYHFNWPNAQAFQTETVNTNQGRNYFYLYNNILFVVLDTAQYPTSNGSSSGGTKDITAAQAHTARFKATIQTAKAAHAGKYDWLIVQHHKSTASVATHIADIDIQAYVEAGFEKIMSDEKVDFVLAGHDHVYARSYPLDGRDGGKVSVPDKTKGTNDNHVFNNPGKPIYLTFTTGSGLKYYPISWDTTFPYTTDNGLATNNEYPYLGNVTNANGDGASMYGTTNYKSGNKPVSNLVAVQPWIPSYCIAEVDGRTIKFSTYAIATKSGTHISAAGGTATSTFNFNANTPYDWVQVSK